MAEALCLAHHNCTIPPRAEHVRGPPEESGKQAALFEFKDLRLSKRKDLRKISSGFWEFLGLHSLPVKLQIRETVSPSREVEENGFLKAIGLQMLN